MQEKTPVNYKGRTNHSSIHSQTLHKKMCERALRLNVDRRIRNKERPVFAASFWNEQKHLYVGFISASFMDMQLSNKNHIFLTLLPFRVVFVRKFPTAALEPDRDRDHRICRWKNRIKRRRNKKWHMGQDSKFSMQGTDNINNVIRLLILAKLYLNASYEQGPLLFTLQRP